MSRMLLTAPSPTHPEAAREEGAVRAVPGTCGELVQGRLGEIWLQVACPIRRFSVARALVREGAGRLASPGGRWKTAESVHRFLSAIGSDTGARALDVAVELRSSLPPGRGMGSSTADVVAAVAAVARALERPLMPDELADVALAVEPSNGVMFDGLALFDHRRGSVREPLGPAPPMLAVVLDFGGCVDTLAFNAGLPRRVPAETLDSWRRAFRLLLLDGLRTRDLAAVGAAATLSARASRALLPRPHLTEVLAVARDAGALGVCAAHSGTILSILLPPDRDAAEEVRRRAQEEVTGLRGASVEEVLGGGVRPHVRWAHTPGSRRCGGRRQDVE